MLNPYVLTIASSGDNQGLFVMLLDARRDNLIRYAREILENLDAYLAHEGIQPVDFKDLFKKGSSRAPNAVIGQLLRFAVELQTGVPATTGFLWSPPSSPMRHPSHPKPASWLIGGAKPT